MVEEETLVTGVGYIKDYADINLLWTNQIQVAPNFCSGPKVIKSMSPALTLMVEFRADPFQDTFSLELSPQNKLSVVTLKKYTLKKYDSAHVTDTKISINQYLVKSWPNNFYLCVSFFTWPDV